MVHCVDQAGILFDLAPPDDLHGSCEVRVRVRVRDKLGGGVAGSILVA